MSFSADGFTTIGPKLARLAIAGGLVASAALQAANLPGRDEYAYGFPLTTAGDVEFYALDLPLDVYRSVSDPQLRDLGVYNAAGQPVPRRVERPGAAERSEQHIPLGLIPLYGEEAEPSEQLRLLLLREPGRTRLELDTEGAGAEVAQQSLAGYLVDARDLEHQLQALALTWAPLAEGFIGAVRLDTSDDLQNWRLLGTSALADLEFEQTRIEQKRLPVRGDISDYLRISWREMPGDWRLGSVHGVYTAEQPTVERRWLELEAEAADGNPDIGEGETRFDAGAFPPVDRVNLLLPVGNIAVRASIHYRPPGQEAWRLAHTGVFYRLARQGNTLQSTAAEISHRRSGPVRARQWKVRIESGITAGPVALQLGWRPDRLLFLAQGEPPFELVSGRAQAALQQFPEEVLLGDASLFTVLNDPEEAGTATAGARTVIAGPSGLAVSGPAPWRSILVWVGLIAAVAVVAWLVYSLAREKSA